MRIIFFTFLLQAYSLKPLMKELVRPLCKDCKFLIGDTLECKKFGDTNLVTGEVTNRYARFMRENGNCGEDGIYFEENNLKIVTVPYYFLKKYWWTFGYLIFTLLYCVASLKIK